MLPLADLLPDTNKTRLPAVREQMFMHGMQPFYDTADSADYAQIADSLKAVTDPEAKYYLQLGHLIERFQTKLKTAETELASAQSKFFDLYVWGAIVLLVSLVWPKSFPLRRPWFPRHPHPKDDWPTA